MVYNRSTRQS